MGLFNRKKQRIEDIEAERQIQEIRQKTLDTIDSAAKNTKKLNHLLEKDGGVTYMVFLATGGDRRQK